MGDDFDAGTRSLARSRVLIAMIRSADLSHLIGDTMNAEYRDRYTVQVEGWIFDNRNPPGGSGVKLHVTVDTRGRVVFDADRMDDVPPGLVELLAVVSLKTRQAASELAEYHASLEIENRDGKRPVSVLESPEVA